MKLFRDVLMSVTAAIIMESLPRIARAQDAPTTFEELPFSELKARIHTNVLGGTTELSFDHTPPDVEGKVKLLGLREGGADTATFIGRALPYLKAHPNQVAVISGHTHPRLVYGRAREVRGTGGLFGTPPQVEEPTDEQKRRYANHSVPPGHGDAGTCLLEQYEARKEGISPRKLLFTVDDAHGTWVVLDRTRDEAEQVAQQYNLPKEMFSRDYAEVESAHQRSREELTTDRQRLFSGAVEKLKDPAFRVRLYEIARGPVREEQLSIRQRAMITAGLATFEYYRQEIVNEWLVKESRYNFKSFPLPWMDHYLRRRGYNAYGTEREHFPEGSGDFLAKVFPLFFEEKELDAHVQLSRRESFLHGQLRHFNLSRGLLVRGPLVERLRREFSVPDSEIDFAVAALRLRQAEIRRSEPFTHQLANASARVRESTPGMDERDIHARIAATNEYIRYRVEMMQYYGQSIVYLTREEFDDLQHDRERLQALTK